MKFYITILFLILSVSGYCQLPKCVQPVISITPVDTVYLNNNNITLTPMATTYNGHGISYWQWIFLTGSGTIQNANAQNAVISNFAQGISTWQVKCVDSCGSPDSVDVIIVALPAPSVVLSSAGSASPSVMQLPVNSTVLSVKNNYPVTCWWSFSGPSTPTFSNPADTVCDISNLTAGTYTFNYSVTTNKTNPPETNAGTVIVIVNAAYTLTLVPNPARTQVTASLTGAGTGPVKIDLYNIAGTKILQQKTGTKTGTTFSATFNMNYKAGTYPMTAILNGAVVATAKLVIL